MFRIVRVELQSDATLKPLPIPTALVICDEPDCGAFTTAPFPYDAARRGQVEVAPEFMRRGWLFDLDKHRCPGHARLVLQAQSLIQVAKAMPSVIDVPVNGRKN